VVGNCPFGDTYNGLQTQRDTGVFPDGLGSVLSGRFLTPWGEEYFETKADLEYLSYLRAIDKVRSRDIDLSVTLGELPETIGLVTDVVGRITRSYREFRRSRFDSALHILGINPRDAFGRSPGDLSSRIASSNYLAYTYGVTPLLNDVYGAISTYEKALKPTPVIYSGSIRRFITKSIVSDTTDGFWNRYKRHRLDALVKSKTKLILVIDEPSRLALEQVGFSNPLNTAWELVPFSFVADWFIPVGSYLESLRPPQGVSITDGYTYTKVYATTEHETDDQVIPGSFPTWNSYAKGWRTKMRTSEIGKYRILRHSWALPRLLSKDFTPSLRKLADALALLHQLAQ
jgi:hypothetical protein